MLTRKMIVAMFMAVLVSMSTTVRGIHYYVDPNGSDDANGLSWPTAFATIQKGIDANDVTVVEVNEGIFYETINFNDAPITLRSAGRKYPYGLTIIDANDPNASVLTFDSGDANSTIEGFAITGGAVGIDCSGNVSPVIRNNLIYVNDYGIKCSGAGSATEIINNTIVSNNTSGIYVGSGGAPTISNCILWGNEDDLNNCSATYSCIEDVNDANGIGNITDDPLFVDADTNDFHLDVNSPCIGAGDPNDNYDGQTDIDGQPRVMVIEVDMGADEVAYLPPCHPDYNEWVGVDNPDCWCYQRQCHGDADGCSQDPNNYWVSTWDLDVLVAGWNKPFEEIKGKTITIGGKEVLLICADFDHKPQGRNNYRLSANDLSILLAYWQIPDGPAPNCLDCPWSIDLDVDTNHDGDITPADDDGEGGVGPNSVGAIVLANCDKDNTTTGAPDNWVGGDWDLNGVEDADEGPNYKVDDNNDKDDLAQLWVHKLGWSCFPDGLTITLKVEKAGENPFFDDVPDCNRIRIFMPTDDVNEPGNLIIEPNDYAIIGPEDGNSFQFNKNSEPNYNIFLGSGIVKFGVEGIEFGAYVDITITAECNDPCVSVSDTVRMRVAPFVLADHKMGVDVDPNSGKTVFVAVVDEGSESWKKNVDLRDKLRTKYHEPNDVNHLDETDIGPGSEWPQDGYEVGYVRAPYGGMPVFLATDRAYSYDGVGELAKYVHNERLKADVGVCWRLKGTSSNYGLTSCGNIESGPAISGPGDFFFGQGEDPNGGKSLDPNVVKFFAAQDVNPALEVNTDWLEVGHVDEVVSFAPDGEHVVVADTEVCWALLLWANDVNSDAIMRIGFAINDETGIDFLLGDPDGQTVSWVLNDAEPYGKLLRQWNLETDDPDYVMALNNLPGVLGPNGLDLEFPESEPIADNNDSNTVLVKAGAFVGFFPDSNERYYQIEFDNPSDTNEYTLKWSYDQSTWYDSNNIGDSNINKDCVFTDAKCFIFKHWWSGTPDAGDRFTFQADPNCKTIEMPVLFYKEYWGLSAAFTTNHINSLADGDTVFTGNAYGPGVLDDPNEPDILMNYVEKLLKKAGFSDVNDADSRVYHNGLGDIHCGTNVQRVIPDYNWWEF